MGNSPAAHNGGGSSVLQDANSIKHLEADFTQLQFGKSSIMAEGKAVIIHTCYSAALKEKVAYKLFREPVDVKSFWNELLFLRKLNHPNITGLRGYIFNNERCAILTDFSDIGSLFDVLHSHKYRKYRPLKFEVFLEFAKDIALGLEYLSSIGLVHKNLKSENVVVKSLDSSPDGLHLIISDFSDLDGKEPISFAPAASSASKFASWTNTLDVYAFGILLWEIFTCTVPPSYAPPILDDGDVRPFMPPGTPLTKTFSLRFEQQSWSDKIPVIPATCPKELGNLMKLCWQKDPSARVTHHEILEALILIEEKYVKKSIQQPNLHIGSVNARRQKRNRIKKARLQRFAKLVAYCNAVASKNVDVTDVQMALNQALLLLQKIDYIQADDQLELDEILEDLEIMLPNEISTAQQQLGKFWSKFSAQKRFRAALEKQTGRLQLITANLQKKYDAGENTSDPRNPSTETVQARVSERIRRIFETEVPDVVGTTDRPSAMAPKRSSPPHPHSGLATSHKPSGDDLLPEEEGEEDNEGKKKENYCDLDESDEPVDPVDSTTDEQLTRLRRLQQEERYRQRAGTTAAESSTSSTETLRTRRGPKWSVLPPPQLSADADPSLDGGRVVLSDGPPPASAASQVATPLGLQPPTKRTMSRVRSTFDELESAVNDMMTEVKLGTSKEEEQRAKNNESHYVDLPTLHQPTSDAPITSRTHIDFTGARAAAVAVSAAPLIETPILPQVKADEEFDSNTSDTEYEDIPTLSEESLLESLTPSRPEEDEKLADFISEVASAETTANRVDELAWDPEAKQFWEKKFGTRTIVSWDEFVHALATTIYVQTDDIHNLKKIMDHNNANYISVHTLAQFLTGNGPFSRCIQKMNSYLKQPWFHWYLEHEECEILMANSPPRTFMVRFSKSNSGFFALSIKLESGACERWLIQSYQGQIRANFSDPQTPVLSDMYSFVQYYTQLGYISQPFIAPWTNSGWFRGLIDGQETVDLLQDKPIGTYLFRLSANGTYLVCAFVVKEGILQEKVLWKPGQCTVESPWSGTAVFRCNSLQEFIALRKDKLITPYSDDMIINTSVRRL